MAVQAILAKRQPKRAATAGQACNSDNVKHAGKAMNASDAQAVIRTLINPPTAA